MTNTPKWVTVPVEPTERMLAAGLIGEARYARMIAAAPPAPVEAETQPIPMILHCPSCHTQHIDAPEGRVLRGDEPIDDQSYTPTWNNPPHRSHLCHNCGTIWRPADVATTGVAAIKSKGSADTPPKEQP